MEKLRAVFVVSCLPLHTSQAHHMDSVHEDVMMRNFDYHAVCKGNRTEPIQSLYKDIETFVGFSGIFCQNGNECIG